MLAPQLLLLLLACERNERIHLSTYQNLSYRRFFVFQLSTFIKNTCNKRTRSIKAVKIVKHVK